MPAVAVVSAAASLPPQSTAVSPTVVASQSRSGPSVALLVLMGGVVVVAIAGGIFIGKGLNPQPPAVTRTTPPAAVPVPTPAVPTPPVAAPIALPTEPVAQTPQPSTEPETAETAETANTPSGHSSHSSGSRGSHRGAASAPAPSGLSAAQAAELARLGARAPSTGGGPVGNNQLRVQQSSDSNSDSSSTNRGPRILRAFQGSHVVNSCWQALLRQNPAVQSVTVRITVGVNSQGGFVPGQLQVSNSPDPRFDACLRSRVANIAPVGAGEAMSAQTSVSLTAGG